jgi:hypothetical protein
MDSVERDERVIEHFSDRGEVYEKIDIKKPSKGIREDAPVEDPIKNYNSSRYFAGRDTGYDDYDEDDDDPMRDDESLDDDNVNIRPEDDDDE